MSAACPGIGRCHGARSWCAECDAGRDGPCDVRARAERCDCHPLADRRLAVLERLEQLARSGLVFEGLEDVAGLWPRLLAWSDAQVAELPEVLHA